jgi:hypothetical protein
MARPERRIASLLRWAAPACVLASLLAYVLEWGTVPWVGLLCASFAALSFSVAMQE